MAFQDFLSTIGRGLGKGLEFLGQGEMASQFGPTWKQDWEFEQAKRRAFEEEQKRAEEAHAASMTESEARAAYNKSLSEDAERRRAMENAGVFAQTGMRPGETKTMYDLPEEEAGPRGPEVSAWEMAAHLDQQKTEKQERSSDYMEKAKQAELHGIDDPGDEWDFSAEVGRYNRQAELDEKYKQSLITSNETAQENRGRMSIEDSYRMAEGILRAQTPPGLPATYTEKDIASMAWRLRMSSSPAGRTFLYAGQEDVQDDMRFSTQGQSDNVNSALVSQGTDQPAGNAKDVQTSPLPPPGAELSEEYVTEQVQSLINLGQPYEVWPEWLKRAAKKLADEQASRLSNRDEEFLQELRDKGINYPSR